MKVLLVLLVSLSASILFASDLKLNGGESAVISANVNTTVTCGVGAGNGSCDAKAQALSSLLDKCITQYQAPWCIQNVYPTWLKTNASCQTEGSAICVEKCSSQVNFQWCFDSCK